MTINEKDDLFQADRRGEERSDSSERRQFLRPTNRLKRKGVFRALLVFAVVAALYFLFAK